MNRSALQKELRKKLPFDSLEQEAGLNLLRSADSLQAELNRLFSEYGISSPQFNVLRILRGIGGDGAACQEIADQMITRTPDITRLVDRLEQGGLVERAKTAEDRRLVLVKIKPAGLDLLARLDQPLLELHKRSLAHLSYEELTQLNSLLVKARQSSAGSTATNG
jgi:DNA-binding MarR family transcriptional regulator